MTIFSRPPSSGFLASIPSPATLYAGLRSVATMLGNRRAARQLSDMPDYLLTDLGLKRDDVHAALGRDWREDPTFQLALLAARRRRGQ